MFVQTLRIETIVEPTDTDDAQYNVYFQINDNETLKFAIVTSSSGDWISYCDVDAQGKAVLDAEDVHDGISIVRDNLTYLEVGDALAFLKDMNFS